LSDDLEAGQFDIGTTFMRLASAGNVIQILSSSSIESMFLHCELAEDISRLRRN
jgi:hypothetical protein